MKRKKEFIIILASIVVIILSVSVAYFTTKITSKNRKVTVTSSELKMVFTSGTGQINSSSITPGWTSGENTFTVTNESKKEYTYNLIIKDYINTTVTTGFLVYKITSTDGGYNMTDFIDMPKSAAAANTTLAENIPISAKATHTYKIEIKYLDSPTVSQDEDQGKKLSGTIFIDGVKEVVAQNLTLASKLLEDNPTISTRTDFSTPFTTNTANTLYKATENGTDVYYFAGVDIISAHCEVEGITGELYKFTDGYNTDLEGIEDIDEETCTTKSLCNLTDYGMVLFGLTQAQCQELAEGQMGYFEESMYSEDLTNRTWYTEVIKPINNWVKFGKNSSNQDLYWRIIRTNSDGSIRLLYHGTSTTATDAYIGKSAFNTNYNSPKYVGYMYGDTDATLEEARTNTNNSTIKTAIDNWYASNMTSYTKYLSTTAVYCNDREVGSGTYSATGLKFNYAVFTRLLTNKTPTYDCTNNNDKFTVDASSGNGKLTYPIALMTADEIAYAGGVEGTEAPMWYYTNSSLESSIGTTIWWSLSPGRWDSNIAFSWNVNGSGNPGNLLRGYVDNSHGVRPAISLKACTLWTSGNGTSETPYEIVETSSGC